MSAQKRKISQINEQKPATQQLAWEIITSDLRAKHEYFKNSYTKIIALPLYTPIQPTTHRQINATLRDIIQFFNDQVLENPRHPSLAIASLQSVSTNKLLSHWNYSSIFNRNLQTVLSREEQIYKDLLKQTILICMRIWRAMFGIYDIAKLTSYIAYDNPAQRPVIAMQDICTLVCDSTITEYGRPWNANFQIHMFSHIFETLVYFLLLTRINTPLEYEDNRDWQSFNRHHPELMHQFHQFMNQLQSRGGFLTANDLKYFFVNIAGPHVLQYAANIDDVYARNDLERFAAQLIRRGKCIDFIRHLHIFGDFCIRNEEQMRYCFSLLTDYGAE